MDLPLTIHSINPAAAYRLNADHTTIEEWRGPGPQPTQVQLDTAWDAIQAEQTTASNQANTLRTQVLTLAGSSVGTAINQLTANQVRALVALLLWKNGALTATGTVKPLDEWAT